MASRGNRAVGRTRGSTATRGRGRISVEPGEKNLIEIVNEIPISHAQQQLLDEESPGSQSGEEISSQIGVGQKKRKALAIKFGLDAKLENAKQTKSHTTTLVNLLHFLTSRSI
ncbi:Uncharacterized protein APZ42_006945 [Daphnia magna]|uniref:Uncharacterized protein n=1 Tax=Daphnia magna TaxID=35525 RepID=A0A162BV99_9CRUS|nr:Uncharacterized protein APZ42_006945 [Daphnia magna]